jgi:hypothetical protein
VTQLPRGEEVKEKSPFKKKRLYRLERKTPI